MHTSFVWVFMRLIWCFGIKIHTLSKVKYFFLFLHKLAPVKTDGKTLSISFTVFQFLFAPSEAMYTLKVFDQKGRPFLRGSRNDLGSFICYTPSVGVQIKVFFSRSCTEVITCSIYTKLVGIMHLNKTLRLNLIYR